MLLQETKELVIRKKQVAIVGAEHLPSQRPQSRQPLIGPFCAAQDSAQRSLVELRAGEVVGHVSLFCDSTQQ